MAVRLSTMPATTAGFEHIFGAPEQLTLTPTTSAGEMNRDQARASLDSPVRARIPAESIWRALRGFTVPVPASIESSA